MRASLLLASVSVLALSTLPTVPYLTTNSGAKVFVSAAPQPIDLDQAAFEALVWVEVKGVGNFGETGENTNILSYDDWGTPVIQKAKGNTDAGSPEIEYRRIPTDPGQTILRQIAKTNLNYAIKTVWNDAETVGGTGTTSYNRGIVAGPKQPNGRSEDFRLEMVTLGLNQVQIIVEPT